MTDISKLAHDERLYYNHLTKPGTPYELLRRREALRDAITKNNTDNRKVAVMALAELHEMTQPKEPDDDSAEAVKKVAQRLYDRGDDLGAKRVLEAAGLSMRSLSVRHGDADFEDRVASVKTKYQERRHDAVLELTRANGWTEEQATKYFTGTPGTPNSLDSALRKQVNLSHRFPGDRPIDVDDE